MFLKSSEVVEIIGIRNDYMRFAFKWEFAQVSKMQRKFFVAKKKEKMIEVVWFNMFRLAGKQKWLIIHKIY